MSCVRNITLALLKMGLWICRSRPFLPPQRG
jgi:hypothetical protein